MFDDFLVRATLASVGVALSAAVLGCFVIWRRMAYFGDATAHAAVLGIALSLTLSAPLFVSVLGVCFIMAMTVSSLNGKGFTMDTLLGVVSHSSLAVGLVAVSFLSGVRIDLMSYLFGDILAVGKMDLMVIWGGALIILALVAWRWSGLLLSTLNEDLARASGFDPKREQLILSTALAVVVAVAIKVVGVLLITAMLIIPAATARPFSKTPEMMAVVAACLGVMASLAGLRTSYVMDTPTGPTIVCISALLFIIINILYRLLPKISLWQLPNPDGGAHRVNGGEDRV
ncbi:metal ABC transporter permease [Alkalimarinus coralli]|uniref:metal ABC transporter permease n=1 Tax=Alkalimarinus coralli TaxID=2935863 RepID=UPI00202B8811|nr:metal ABC transporter permease [Alkalimarinus coralli]